MAARAILLIAIIAALVGIIHADEINANIDAIFVGKIIKFGPVALGSSGVSLVCGNKIKVLQVLRGSIEAEVSVTIHAGPGLNSGEPKLEIGDSAIFYVHKVVAPDPDPYDTVLIRPVTKEAVDRLKKS